MRECEQERRREGEMRKGEKRREQERTGEKIRTRSDREMRE